MKKKERKMEDNNIKKICKFARKFRRRRDDAALCFRGKTKKQMLAFVNFPDRISNIPNCVATEEFSTGHSEPDCYINKSNMYDCPRRKNK